MSGWTEALVWGLVGGGALVLGATAAWFLAIPRTAIATVMAFGAGVLISALAFDLAAEAADVGGLAPTIVGFLAGGAMYVLANAELARRGARYRKRATGHQPASTDPTGSGSAIAIGALLDGVPESVVLGISLLGGTGVSTALVVAVFLSNVPEGMSSAAGMKADGRSARYIFGVWTAIALASGAAAAVGYATMGTASPATVAVITSVAAGAILTMVADTMIPEAFARTHLLTGFITSLGFLTAFTISRLGG